VKNELTEKSKRRMMGKGDDFSFPVINFPILDGYLPLSPSYGVYFSQLVRFSRIRNDVSDFSVRNLVITETLVQQ
jgi:hypothetical protein